MTLIQTTDIDIAKFEKTRFEQLEHTILIGDTKQTQELATIIQKEFQPVHDGLVEAVTSMLSFFVKKTSPHEGEQIGRHAMERHMKGEWFDQYLGNHGNSPDQLRRQIRDIITTWHWHPSQITVTEDEEKVTIHTHPCGSGMRLEQQGKYDSVDGYARSVTPTPSNFMEKDFPIYCNHCPEMNFTSLHKGATTWLVEGWKPNRNCRSGNCSQHSYKRLVDVPEEFFTRVGLTRPSKFPNQSDAKVRLFSDEELAALSMHPTDRLAIELEDNGIQYAQSALHECENGWRGMHDAFTLFLGIFLTEALDNFGYEGMIESLEHSSPKLLANIWDGTDTDWASYWSMHMGLTELHADPSGYNFFIEPESLINPETWPASIEEFCRAINKGLNAIGRDDIGSFTLKDGMIMHHLPSSNK